MSLTAAQLEVRKHGIGGSEIAAIVGMDPFRGALDVYLAKVEGWQQEQNEDMKRGTFLEDGVARWYADREQCAPMTSAEVFTAAVDGTIQHAKHPLILCTPDRLVPLLNPWWRLLSIKCPRRAGDKWGETGGGLIPEGHVLQLQIEDAVVRSLGFQLEPVSHLAALVEGDLRVYPVERDVEMQGWLIDFAESWWAKHVVAKVPPPLDGSDGASAWLRRRFPSNTQPARPATAQEEVWALELQGAEEAKDAATKAHLVRRQKLEEAIGNSGGLDGTFGSITWRANKNGVRAFRTNWK